MKTLGWVLLVGAALGLLLRLGGESPVDRARRAGL